VEAGDCILMMEKWIFRMILFCRASPLVWEGCGCVVERRGRLVDGLIWCAVEPWMWMDDALGCC
jgi:hypothetical protein